MTIFYLCLLVLVSLYLLSNVIEPYEYETKFTQNDLKFIPYSSSPDTNALNNYVIRAVKLKKPYLMSSILDANRNYNTHSVFEFPTNDPRKSVHVTDFDIEKDYHGQFRPIITHNKDRQTLYENETKLDHRRINDPFEVEMDPKHLESTIDYNPRDPHDSLNTLLTDKTYRGQFKPGQLLQTYDYDQFGKRFECPWGFSLDTSKLHRLRHKNYTDAVSEVCRLR